MSLTSDKIKSMAKAAKAKTGIPQTEQEQAAMYFTMSNCAVLELIPYGQKNLIQAYHYVNGIVESETGTSMDAEKRDWIKSCKKAKSGYLVEEWEKVKINYNL